MGPWADQRDGRWCVADEETLPDLLAAFQAQARRRHTIVAAHGLDEVGPLCDLTYPGGCEP